MQIHHHRSEHWVVVKGTAEVTLSGEKHLLSVVQKIVALVGPPMVALVIYGVSLVAPRKFAAASWKNYRNLRPTMIDDFASSHSAWPRGKKRTW